MPSLKMSPNVSKAVAMPGHWIEEQLTLYKGGGEAEYTLGRKEDSKLRTIVQLGFHILQQLVVMTLAYFKNIKTYGLTGTKYMYMQK